MRDTDEIDEQQDRDAFGVEVISDATNKAPDEPEVPSLMEIVGGPLGIVESTIPTVVFVISNTASQDVNLSAAIAIMVAAIAAFARLIRHESPRASLLGLAGVAVAALYAAKTGKAENFYLPGLLLNAGYALMMLGSVAVRWPAVGLVSGQIDGNGTAFRRDPVHFSVANRATLMWAAMFLTRIAVQLPMYLAGSVVALGVARVSMGLPLFALCTFLTYSWMRALPPLVIPQDELDDESADDGDEEYRGPGADLLSEWVGEHERGEEDEQQSGRDSWAADIEPVTPGEPGSSDQH